MGAGTPIDIDTSKRFIRVIDERADGFVEFEFAIGEPELYVELVMSNPAFKEFRQEQMAEMLPPRPDEGPDFASDEFRVSWLKGGGLDAIKELASKKETK